jgi:DNA-binding FrmR family transcriptional regulator
MDFWFPRPSALSGALAMSRIADPEKKKALCARLARIEGQLRGLQKLIQEDADCEKVAQQMAAARKALDKSFFSMVGCMIEQGDQSADHVAEMLTKFA